MLKIDHLCHQFEYLLATSLHINNNYQHSTEMVRTKMHSSQTAVVFSIGLSTFIKLVAPVWAKCGSYVCPGQPCCKTQWVMSQMVARLLCNNQNGSIHCQILDSPEKLSYSLEPQNAAIVKISCMFWNGGDKI